MSIKIVINTCYGGFSLSAKALKLLGKDEFDESGIPRNDPDLVRVVEQLGSAASGTLAALKVVEIPDGVEWQIDEYDGSEWVAEKHRRWL